MNVFTDPAKLANTQHANEPSYQSAAYVAALPDLDIVSDLDGGTTRIRSLSTKYLPKMPMELDGEYNARLRRSVCYNVFPEILNKLVGSKFRKDPTPTEELPVEIEEFLTDVDGLGTDAASFLDDLDYRAMRDGHSFLYVETPPPPDDNGEMTLADDDRRPYWIPFDRDQAINWKHERHGNRMVLSQITFRIASKADDGTFGEKDMVEYLVLRRGSWSRYAEDKKGRTMLQSSGFTGLTEIPLAVHYGGYKMDELVSKPPLIEVAHQVLLHFQKLSDFDNWTHLSCVPLLIRQLENENDSQDSETVPIGPSVMIDIYGRYSKIYYAEVSGDGLEITRERIKDVERHIAKLSLEMYSPDHQTVRTATEIVSDKTQEQSALARAARSLTACFARALTFTGEYFNLIQSAGLDTEELGSIQLNIDYDALTFSVEQLAFFETLVDKRRLSLRTFLTWLPKIAHMPDGFNADDEIEQIIVEQGSPEMGGSPGTGGGNAEDQA